MNTPLLLDYCPPFLRTDLWANDGFDPHNEDDIADDPNRALRMMAAERARKNGITTDEQIGCELVSGCELLGMDLTQLDLVRDPVERCEIVASLRELRSTITRAIHRARKGAR